VTRLRPITCALAVLVTATCANAQQGQPAVGATVPPPEAVVAEGVPPIPAALAEQVGRYTDFRAAVFVDWHPTRREMLINTRFADTAQVHHVKMPGGARTQLTFYKEPARGGLVRPKRGDSFVFLKDVGGNEFFQLFRYDLATGDVALLTDGKSRNTGPDWSHDGRLLAYTSTRRNGKDNDLYVIDPADPKTDRRVAEVEGGGWGVHDWSPDGTKLLAGEYISANESYLWLVDARTGDKKLVTPRGGAEKVAYDAAKFDHDGTGVYATTDKGGEFLRLAHVDLSTGRHEFLTDDIKWDVEGFDWLQGDSGCKIGSFADFEQRVARANVPVRFHIPACLPHKPHRPDICRPPPAGVKESTGHWSHAHGFSVLSSQKNTRKSLGLCFAAQRRPFTK